MVDVLETRLVLEVWGNHGMGLRDNLVRWRRDVFVFVVIRLATLPREICRTFVLMRLAVLLVVR